MCNAAEFDRGVRRRAWILLPIACALICRGAVAEAPRMLPRQGVTDDTTVVKDGRANAVIVFPEKDAAYQPLVAKIRQAVSAATGVELPALADAKVLAPGSRFFLAPSFKAGEFWSFGDTILNSFPWAWGRVSWGSGPGREGRRSA